MEIIKVRHSAGEYNIYAGGGILDAAIGDFVTAHKDRYDRVFIVSDSNVFPIYGELLHRIFVKYGVEPVGEYAVEAGEKSKTLATVADLYKQFAASRLTRKSLAVALGGGVCGDMVGFAAATYLRGIDILQIPTTLLSQIDSSIGGKTGVDLDIGKNLVGAFWQPAAVIADSDFLKALPERYLRDGMGEAIKYGCIADAELFSAIAEKRIAMSELIGGCMKIKAAVVEADECETGLRMILNYGHTLGHAVEKLGDFSRFSHGESVGIGMLYAAKIGERLGYPTVYDKIKSALSAWGLPTESGYTTDELLAVAASDKKRAGDAISFVLLERLGSAITRKLTFDELRELLK